MKLTRVLYVTQAVKNILSVSSIMPKGTTMGDNQDKINIKINGVSVIVDSSKGQNKSMVFCLKAKRYDLEGHEALTNLP